MPVPEVVPYTLYHWNGSMALYSYDGYGVRRGALHIQREGLKNYIRSINAAVILLGFVERLFTTR